jgi:hypothetical protein
MQRRAVLRASDQDREHVAERLRTAALEGRLTSDELDERIGRAYAGRTYGELDELLADLPLPAALPARRVDRSVTRTRRRPPALVATAGGLTLLLVALMTMAHSGAVDFGRAASAAPGPHSGQVFMHSFTGFALAGAAAAAFAGLCLVLVVVAVVGWMLMRPWSTRDA